MLVQSGKPVGVFRTHEWAPRVLIANSNLVPEWATWDEFRRLEQLGLTMYGQMTAGLVDLHRHAGHPAGHLRVLRRDRPPPLRRHAGRHDHAHRRPRRHGRRAAARRHHERRRRAVHRRRRPTASSAASRPATSTRWPTTSTTRSPAATRPRPTGAPCSIGLRGQRRRRGAAAARARASTPTSSPTRPAPTTRSATCPTTSPRRRPSDSRARDPEELRPPVPEQPWRRTARRWSASSTRAPRSSTTATACGPRPGSAGSTGPSTTRASCPPTSGRCSARARARSAGSRSRATRPTSPPPTRPCSRSSPTTRGWPAGSAWPASGSPSRACRPASAGSGYGERHRLGLRFNELVRTGRVSAPIVIGRDHLDSGSVASPYRETEAMADGSDAIADWPLLNALVNTSSGATWVSIHHGGGVGIGRSIHAGMVVRGRRHRPGGREARAGARRPIRAWASSATPTPATSGRDRGGRRAGRAPADARGPIEAR